MKHDVRPMGFAMAASAAAPAESILLSISGDGVAIGGGSSDCAGAITGGGSGCKDLNPIAL